MSLQTDFELNSLLRGEDALIKKIELDQHFDGIYSPIQPCSVDLKIDKIYLPTEEEREIHEIPSVKCKNLEVGQSVKVTTIEEFNLPDNFAGLLLAPARLTRQGVMVLDIGHIDPGFRGELRLTLINMGKNLFKLKHGETVATVLIFKLEKSVKFGLKYRQDKLKSIPWLLQGRQERKSPYEKGLEDIKCLSPDFLNIRRCAGEIAKKETEKALKKSGLTVGFTSIFIPIIVALLSAFGAYHFAVEERIKVAEIESKTFQTNLKSNYDQQFLRLENEIDKLKNSPIAKEEFNTRLIKLELELQRLNQEIQRLNKEQ